MHKRSCFFNSQTKNYYKSSIDSFLKNPDFRPAKSILFNSEIKKLNAFNDSVFVAEGSFGNCRLALYNEKGLLLNTILKYPEIDQANTKEYLRLAYQGKFSLKPNDMKFAYMTYNSSNIGFYKIEGKEIHLIKEIFLQNPLKELTSSGDLKACVPLKDCKVGYSDIFSTQKFLYALYSDEKVLNNKSKSSDILVYDWNGNPIKILKLDKKVSFICVSENDSILYAISNDGREVNILSFKLL